MEDLKEAVLDKSEGTKVIREPATETRFIFQLLMAATLEEPLVTYAQMMKETGCDPQNRGRGYLTTARKMAEREGKAFAVERGVGVRLMEDGETVESCASDIEKIRRASRRSIRKQKTADISKLDHERRDKYFLNYTIHTMIDRGFAPSRVKQLGEAVAQTGKELPLQRALEAMKDGSVK